MKRYLQLSLSDAQIRKILQNDAAGKSGCSSASFSETKSAFGEAKRSRVYSPKIDIRMKNVNGKEAGVHCAMISACRPVRLSYIGSDGSKSASSCTVHLSALSTHYSVPYRTTQALSRSGSPFNRVLLQAQNIKPMQRKCEELHESGIQTELTERMKLSARIRVKEQKSLSPSSETKVESTQYLQSRDKKKRFNCRLKNSSKN